MLANVLKGIRVVDFSRLLPGPYFTSILVDMGADVLKIEDTLRGDYMRDLPPSDGTFGARFTELNRGKKSISLNLKTLQGQEIARALCGKADVVVESFRKGVMERLGLPLQAMRESNDKLITCSLVGFPSDSTYALKAGHDANYLALSGVQYGTGVGGQLSLPAIQFADLAGGSMWALSSVLGALYAREVDGSGRHLEIAMSHGVFALASCDRVAKEYGEVEGPGNGLLSGGVANYQIYETKDGRHISVAALEPKFWQAVRSVAEDCQQDITPVPSKEELTRFFRSKSLDEWRQLFASKDACVEPILNFKEAAAHPANSKVTRSPMAPGNTEKAPCNGQHTREVLESMGFSSLQIDEFVATGAVGE